MLGTALALAMLADAATTAPAATTPAAPPAAVNPADKKICKRFAVTGSLVAQKKVCHTKAEWDVLADQARDDVETLQESRGYRAPQ